MGSYKAILLWSGGIDSTLCLYRLMRDENCEKVLPIFFNYDQQGYEAERYCVTQARASQPIDHKVEDTLNLSVSLRGHWLTDGQLEKYSPGYSPALVPGRNTVFASIAYFYARQIKADMVVIGIHGPLEGSEWDGVSRVRFPDCTQEWVDAMNTWYTLENKACTDTQPSVFLVAPIINMTKSEIVSEARDLGVNEHLTHACYFPTECLDPCGKCEACIARQKGGLAQ